MSDTIRMLVTITPAEGDERTPMGIVREVAASLSVGLALSDRASVRLIAPNGDVLDPAARWRIVERDEGSETTATLVGRVLTAAGDLGRRAREEAADEPAALRADLDLDEVVKILRTKHGIESAYVEMTGGGVATIYAGPTRDEPNWGPRYAAIAGPGWFEGAGYTRPRADLSDFYIGADDDGQTTPVTVPPGTSLETVAALIAAQANLSDPTQALGADDLERLGLDPGLRGPVKLTSPEYTED